MLYQIHLEDINKKFCLKARASRQNFYIKIVKLFLKTNKAGPVIQNNS